MSLCLSRFSLLPVRTRGASYFTGVESPESEKTYREPSPPLRIPVGSGAARHHLPFRKGKSWRLKRYRRYLFALPRDRPSTPLSREGYPDPVAVCLPPSELERKRGRGRNKRGLRRHKRRSYNPPESYGSRRAFVSSFLLTKTYICNGLLNSLVKPDISL